MTVLAYVLSGLLAAGIIFIGARYLLAPATMAAQFGVPRLTTGTDAFYNVKGVRDIASGLLVAVFIIYGEPHVLGLLMLTAAVIPLGDMLVVLRHNGSKAAAFGIHGGTALAMLVVAALLLTR